MNAMFDNFNQLNRKNRLHLYSKNVWVPNSQVLFASESKGRQDIDQKSSTISQQFTLEQTDPIKNSNLFELTQVIQEPYKYGFTTDIESEKFPTGINEKIIQLISSKKQEPPFLLDFRLRSYKKWKMMDLPTWANLSIGPLDFENITYYSMPKKKDQTQDRPISVQGDQHTSNKNSNLLIDYKLFTEGDLFHSSLQDPILASNPWSSFHEVDPEILKTFEKLGISLEEQNDSFPTMNLSPEFPNMRKGVNRDKKKNIAIDAVFDSVSIATTYKEKLAKTGVIFCSISDAIEFYPNLVKKFLGSVVSSGDNFFAALNSAVFSDGSFCYIPQNVHCPMELSTYFRLNDKESGQFERTLIIVEKNGSVNYLEGCTAPQYSENQLHAAIVELIAFENAEIKYSTVQNWYGGDEAGLGGIYNFVTKRGLAAGKNAKIFWTQVETGSSITWKYPSCILLGASSVGEFYSIALTNNYQQADTGTKMIHLGRNTRSKIISKGISSGFSKNSYRGLVKISPTASSSRNFSQCDSFLLGSSSVASTYPYLESWNSNTIIEHEAKISKISEDQLFYLVQRGIGVEKAVGLLVSGFCKDVLNMLPLEFASEADKLLSLKLEGTVG